MKHITLFEDFEYIKEDTSATGGPPSSGMGAVVSANPSSLAGSTIGTNWVPVEVQLDPVIFQFLIIQVVQIE
jgi:hypothetical protein